MVELEAPFICKDGGGGTAASCTWQQTQRRNTGPTEAQLGGGSGHASGVVVLMKAEKADGEI